MPKISITIPHGLSRDEALRRIKIFFGEVKMQFADKISDLREEWDGNIGRFSFSAMKFSVSGTLAVEDGRVEVSGSIPFAAAFLKGRIEAAIKKQASSILV